MEEFDAETRQQYLAEFDSHHRRATMYFISKMMQATSVAAFQSDFEEDIHGITGLFEPLVASYFISGLRSEIRRELLRTCPWPSTLVEAFAMARTCEARVETTHSDLPIVSPVHPDPSEPLASSPPPLSGKTSSPSPCPAPTTTLTTIPKTTPRLFVSPSNPPSKSNTLPLLSANPTITSSPSLDPQFSDPLPNPSPDPSIYSTFNQFSTIHSLSLGTPLKTINSSISLTSILHSSTIPFPNLFPLSKPPPEPPDPDPCDKRKDELGPKSDNMVKSGDNRQHEELTSLFEHFLIVGLQSCANIQVVEDVFARRKNWELEAANSEIFDLRKMEYHGHLPFLEPQMFFNYPPGKRLAMAKNELSAFCFPEGVQVRLLEKTPSRSDLNEVVLGQEHLARDGSSFIFSFKVSDSTTLYGICLHVQELLHFEMLNSIIAHEHLDRVKQYVSEMAITNFVPQVVVENDQLDENYSPDKESNGNRMDYASKVFDEMLHKSIWPYHDPNVFLNSIIMLKISLSCIGN